jgi:hypothetical protein
MVISACVLPIYAWHYSVVYVASASPVSALTLKDGARVAGVTPRGSWSFVSLQCT